MRSLLGRWRPADVWDALGAFVVSAVALGVAVWTVDGVTVHNPLGIAVAALAVGVGDLAIRPLLSPLARAGGVPVALLTGLGAQLAIAFAGLWFAPGIEVRNGWSAVAVLVIAAVVMATGRWLWGSHDSDYVVGDMVRAARRHARRSGLDDGPGTEPGLLVVILDGVARPVLDQAIEAGLAPTLQRWLTSGSHVLDGWWAQVPSSTPATQAGLLYGRADAIPAFRWWDRDLGRLVVTNHPRDAAAVDAVLSDGAGLLAGGGTAVSLMFSGDAVRSFLVMSRGRPAGGPPDLGPGTAYLRFFARPFLLARALTLTVGEMVKEVYQGRRARVNGVRPRIGRLGWHVLLRAVTNVLLRDMSTSLVADAMVRGDPVVVVDYVDYDVVAHYSGPVRPESLRSLEGLDGVLATLETVAGVARRRYRVVVLSDHGQALGETFAQLSGATLLSTVRALMHEPQAPGVESVANEDWGPLNALLAPFQTAARRPVGPAVEGSGTAAARPEVVVGASGNLGMVWFPRHDHRLTLDELQDAWPGLVAGLAARLGVGAVLVDSARGLLVIGPRGVRPLEDADHGGVVEGVDPLAGYPPRAAADLARLGRLPHVGDLVVLSTVTGRGHVHAFENQVGSHGGLGGDQNDAFLLHPVEWPLDDDLLGEVGPDRRLVGADAVGAQLRRWAVGLGLRTGPDQTESDQPESDRPRSGEPGGSDRPGSADADTDPAGAGR